jgi:hypothetical protein
MTYKLKLDFHPQENPFEQDRSEDLIWGQINLAVTDYNDQIIQDVINMIWDVKELVQWIIRNEDVLLNEEFPKPYIKGGSSIAEYIDKYYEICRSADEIDDEADDIIEKYKTHHCIYCGMSGTQTISAYIGKTNKGHEISYYNTEYENWKYQINLMEFIQNVKTVKENLFPQKLL